MGYVVSPFLSRSGNRTQRLFMLIEGRVCFESFPGFKTRVETLLEGPDVSEGPRHLRGPAAEPAALGCRLRDGGVLGGWGVEIFWVNTGPLINRIGFWGIFYYSLGTPK